MLNHEKALFYYFNVFSRLLQFLNEPSKVLNSGKSFKEYTSRILKSYNGIGEWI